MDKKIEETREFLQMIGMPKAQQADICCYVILAMAGVKPDMSWSEATNEWIRIHDIIQLLRSRAGANDRQLLDFFADGSALQRENHIGRPFKIADVPFPAHPTPAMLQARKLLLHFPAAVWAGFIAGSHPHPP